MRFFDEDNKRFEWTLGVVSMFIVLYLSSYVIARTQNTSPCEEDGCYYEVVDIPQAGFWKIYGPLMAVDEKYFRARFPKDAEKN